MTECLDGLVLVARESCDACEGVGERASEDWEAFNAWARRQGYVSAEQRAEHVEDYFLDVCGFDAVPPMRTTCEPCEGTGKVDTELDVAVLLDALLSEVDRPPVDRGEIESAIDSVRRTLTMYAERSEGLADPDEAGSNLRVVQEAAEAMRSLCELLPRRAT